MRAYRFPILCPVCGINITNPSDAMANHKACHTQAYQMAAHANAMRDLALDYPDHTHRVTRRDNGMIRVNG
jgi:hypothetical protein